MKKFAASGFVLLFLLLLLLPHAPADEPSLPDIGTEELMEKVRSAQSRVLDMQADMTTSVVSNIARSEAPVTAVQKGRVWTKGRDMSRVEIVSPVRQTTVTNGDMMMVISPDTRQRFVQDLKKLGEGQSRPGAMDHTKALKYFDLAVARAGSREYVISGKPKEANQFLGRMDFFIDAAEHLPVRIAIYDAGGRLLSLSEIEYSEVAGIPVLRKTSSAVSTPMGSVDTVMAYSNIRVNEGIDDDLFRIN